MLKKWLCLALSAVLLLGLLPAAALAEEPGEIALVDEAPVDAGEVGEIAVIDEPNGDGASKYSAVYVAGNGKAGGSWLGGVSWDPGSYKNKMTEIEPNRWLQFYTKVAPGEYEFKFTIGSWDQDVWTYDGDPAVPGEYYFAEAGSRDSVSIHFTLTQQADVGVAFDYKQDQPRFAVAVSNVSGQCGDNLTWKLSYNLAEMMVTHTIVNTLTISGSGEMWDFSEQEPDWAWLHKCVTKLVVKNGVTSIGSYAFGNSINLSEVSLPESLKSIGKYAFGNCALNAFTVPKDVTSIGFGAFFGNRFLEAIEVESGNTVFASIDGILCSKDGTRIHTCPGGKDAGSLVLPDTVKEICAHAFEGCTKLTAITLPKSLTAIRARAFAGCTALQEILFLGNAPTFAGDAFAGVKATAIYMTGTTGWSKSALAGHGGELNWEMRSSAAPPALKPGSSSTKGLGLAWEAVPGAGLYEVQRKDGGAWTTLGKVEEAAFIDSAALMNETYTYRARAYEGGAWTAFGDELSVSFNPFTDVSGKKTLEYVAWAYNNGIVKGTSTTAFSPDTGCTRIQFVMMLWKMHGSPEVGGKNPFSDVSGSKTIKAVLWALDKGVINSGAKFDPDGNISRVQIVMILWKLAGSPEVAGDNPFTDVSGKKTTKAVLWAYYNGITKGTSATTFAPDNDCTRVQLVVFLYKYNDIYQVI